MWQVGGNSLAGVRYTVALNESDSRIVERQTRLARLVTRQLLDGMSQLLVVHSDDSEGMRVHALQSGLFDRKQGSPERPTQGLDHCGCS